MYQLVIQPVGEPVTLAEAKLHLRVDYTDDDALITSLITVARQYAEGLTHRSFITQTWKYAMDAFPGPGMMGVTAGRSFSLPAHAILLEYGNVISITSITYLDMASVLQTMPFQLSNPVLYYNKKSFRAAGLDPEKPPITLNDIIDASRKIVATGKAKGATDKGFALEIQAWYPEQFLSKAATYDQLPLSSNPAAS